MSSIRWSPEAADDLERIYRRIETDNPAVALGVVQTIYDAATTLQTFPERGRLSRRSGAREIVFSPALPYILSLPSDWPARRNLPNLARGPGLALERPRQ